MRNPGLMQAVPNFTVMHASEPVIVQVKAKQGLNREFAPSIMPRGGRACAILPLRAREQELMLRLNGLRPFYIEISGSVAALSLACS